MILVFGEGQLGRELSNRAASMRAVVLHTLSHAQAEIADSAAVAAESNLEKARQGNEIGPAVVAEACAGAGIPMVHISTDYVFDGTKQDAYQESDPVHPVNVYVGTKSAGEDAVRRILKHHLILRPAWVCSKFGHNFLKTILRRAASRDELRIVADQQGGPTSAGELAEAVLNVASALPQDRTLAATYHFTAAGIACWHGFATRIVEVAAPVTGRMTRVIAVRTADYRTAAKRPANLLLHCRLFIEEFALLTHHWTEGVDAMTRTLIASSQRAENHVT